MVIEARPDIISHNMETVRRISPLVRSAANYDTSLQVIRHISGKGVKSKSGIMVGLGETPEEVETKKFKSITVSGNVPLERYTELFNYFITPFAMSGNKIDIEVSFKIKSNAGSPIDESKQQYKSAKEAAKQLGLRFEEE